MRRGRVINGRTADVVQEVMRLTGGRGTDLVIETAGTEATTRQAIQMAKKARPSCWWGWALGR